MYIIAVGWIYVVLMMSITEVSIVAGVMTFLLYGVLPVAIIMYLGGSRSRRRSRQQAGQQIGENPSASPVPAAAANSDAGANSHALEAEASLPEHQQNKVH